MTTSPQLPNHLIRELLHIIRLKDDGDAMVLLALSGKETFPVFKYVVETCLEVVLDDGDIIKSSIGMELLDYSSLKFSTEGSQRLVSRFVRKLYAHESPLRPLQYDAITKITILFDSIRCYASILASWDNVERLTMFGISEFFLTEVRTGVLLLTNLRELVMCSLNFDELFKPMETNPHFPYPELVALALTVDKDVVPYAGSLPTFPKVKDLELDIELEGQITPEVFRQVAAFVNCFPSLETTHVVVNYCHEPFPEESVITNFHEPLQNTDFHTPVKMNFTEYVYGANKPVKSMSEQWKSYGFEEDGDASMFIIEKECGNVKLVHRIKHRYNQE